MNQPNNNQQHFSDEATMTEAQIAEAVVYGEENGYALVITPADQEQDWHTRIVFEDETGLVKEEVAYWWVCRIEEDGSYTPEYFAHTSYEMALDYYDMMVEEELDLDKIFGACV